MSKALVGFFTLAVMAVAAIPIATGCSDSDENGSSFVDMRSAVADARAENTRHAEACHDADSMGAMDDEVDRHEGAMDELMDRMQDRRRDMMGEGMGGGMMGDGMGMHCSGPEFDDMSDRLDEMHEEMADHIERMRGADALEDARSECSAHADDMDSMMDHMMDDLDAMPCMQGS